MPTEHTVFIVDDDPECRESLAAWVQTTGLRVEKYGSAEEFLAAYQPTRYGCAICDLRMPGMGGLALQEALSARGIRLPLIMITAFGDELTAVRAVQAGVFAFLEKPCRPPELSASLHGALAASSQYEKHEERRADIRQRLAQLSPDEQLVMREMVAGKANKVIAAEMDMGLRTVELRRANILKKMQADSLAELVRLVLSAEDPGRYN